ncbi:hypothetical protein OPV22_022813 [Ensete ventricosum]|uniref:Secreted protein n=1 Tax=Ensete ventricosum TaxID=4639 RepID=A0AAV8PEH8_ENSVE|nr:hypothetical protein OPV22_022813 [Ensete ventricosum]
MRQQRMRMVAVVLRVLAIVLRIICFLMVGRKRTLTRKFKIPFPYGPARPPIPTVSRPCRPPPPPPPLHRPPDRRPTGTFLGICPCLLHPAIL